MPGHGLIVGKFYPPHRGHKHLIDFARSRADELSVIVCQKPGESPCGELRAAWLREIHPTTKVLLLDDVYDEQDSRVWAENSVRWLGFVPDVVFTSEDYGERFAHFLGCEHVLVDKDRQCVPISGTIVRSNRLVVGVFSSRRSAPGMRNEFVLSERNRPARPRWRRCWLS